MLRLACSEILEGEHGHTSALLWLRAHIFFVETGLTAATVMTDVGACYRSRDFGQALGVQVKYKRTRPYRPQTNGKVERFNRTLATEWAYHRLTAPMLIAPGPTWTGSATTVPSDAHRY
ncbi:transposase InsO family protein [Micrococcus sp. TA1]|nr:transposase InsO family protein [Micrococcus sp. TA1]